MKTPRRARRERTRELKIKGYIEGVMEHLSHARAHCFEIDQAGVEYTLVKTAQAYMAEFPNSRLTATLKALHYK